MEFENLNNVFKRTYMIQIITVWTIIVLFFYFFHKILLIGDVGRHILLWGVGTVGILFISFRRRNIMGWGELNMDNDQHISNLLCHAMVETSPDSVAITDLLGNYIFANKQTALLHGYDSPEDFAGKNALSLFPLNEVAKATKYMDLTRSDGIIKNVEFNILRKDGTSFPAELSAALVKNEFGIPAAFIAITRDITERKRAADQLHDMNEQLHLQLDEIKKLQAILREQAVQDPLTGLYNRRYMEEALTREAARATREGYPVSIVMLDMDNLKYLNDTYGHIVGDEAIKMVGKNIKMNIRTEDIACRYGGDEFLVILHNTTAKTAKHRVEEWLNRITERSFIHNRQKFRTAFSAGIASFPLHGRDIEGVIRSADHALYDAKTKGKNLVVISTEGGVITE